MSTFISGRAMHQVEAPDAVTRLEERDAKYGRARSWQAAVADRRAKRTWGRWRGRSRPPVGGVTARGHAQATPRDAASSPLLHTGLRCLHCPVRRRGGVCESSRVISRQLHEWRGPRVGKRGHVPATAKGKRGWKICSNYGWCSRTRLQTLLGHIHPHLIRLSWGLWVSSLGYIYSILN